MKVTLPYPAAELWPNTRAHWASKARAVKAARNQAYWLAKEAGELIVGNGEIAIKITVCGKPTGPLPDKDNCASAAKSLLDGIADALGVNDKRFAAPIVVYSAVRSSRFIIEVGERATNVCAGMVNAAWDDAIRGKV
jgi:crossover junction endodeoxyribonuclease RusA